MRRISFLLASLLSAASYALETADVQGHVEWNSQCTGIADLGIGAKAVLDGGARQAGITSQGNFIIPQVPAGTYVLSIISHSHSFNSFQVNVEPPQVHVRTFTPGTPMIPSSALSTTPTLKYPVVMTPKLNYRTAKAYFVPREGFNLVGMFQSPMMLMMVFAGVMMLATPYLMKNLENMDPESAEELREQQAKIANIQNALSKGDFKAGLSQFLSSDEPSSSAVAPKQASQPKGKKSGKGKK